MHRISPLLSVYLGGRFLAAFGAALGLIAALIVLFDAIELLRRSAPVAGVGTGAILGLALLKLPHTIQNSLPFVVMIAVMYALFRLSRHHELVVMRAVGVSAWQVLAPTVVLVAALGAVNLLVVNPLAATLYDAYKQRERDLIDTGAAAFDLGRSGFWLRESAGTGNAATATVVHADAVRQDGGALHLSGVSMFVSDAAGGLVRRFQAETAVLGDGYFHMSQVLVMEPGQPTRRFPSYRRQTAITLTQIQDSFAAPETLSVYDLPGFVAFSRAAGFSALPHRLYWQSLLATPVMLCAMVLVAASFYLTGQARLGGWTLRALGGIGAGFLLYFFSRFTYALGLSATLPLPLAAWSPAVVALLLSLSYLFYAEDG
ncbi:MAG: LptF/LptG family permease [Rhodospirillaceae bacterium]|nr:LptF/LptG family permease [Rhodospirillaceae bacterium]